MAEREYKGRRVFYSSPAFPPDNVKTGITYVIEKDNRCIYIVADGERLYRDEKYFKELFTFED